MLLYLPHPSDNVAIATQDGTVGDSGTTQFGTSIRLNSDVPVGFRIAVEDIECGDNLLSWGNVFGMANCDIQTGEAVYNKASVDAIEVSGRITTTGITENFVDYSPKYSSDSICIANPQRIIDSKSAPKFMGYQRDGDRGIGTRNYIAVVATSSLAASCARLITQRVEHLADVLDNLNGIVCVEHTEGARANASNTDIVLSTLAGFLLHPNLAAVLLVDHSGAKVQSTNIINYLQSHHDDIVPVTNQTVIMDGDPSQSIEQGVQIVHNWIVGANSAARSAHDVSELKIALQCGGSDAFSGITGNPLMARVASKLISHGGSINFSETPELIGAESYVLNQVANSEIGNAFMERVEHFKDWVGEHGHSAEGNPSHGNLMRGLYNITIKSLGAAMKRPYDLPLEHVVPYSERMTDPGAYFMDSPGNDIESVTGQVASGCNLIMFVTGNGSVTNFPFVPTVKVITTSAVYNKLSAEMDVNAGRILENSSIDEESKLTYALVQKVASGQETVGEKAGHSQVQIWRDWGSKPEQETYMEQQTLGLDGQALSVRNHLIMDKLFAKMKGVVGNPSNRQCSLILPTSLCAGQVANMAAKRLNLNCVGHELQSKYVTLPHTEGCGVSSGHSEKILLNILKGYLCHPLIRDSLVLEHGCEKLHLEYMRRFLLEENIDPSSYGWASIQKDGGIESVLLKIEDWFSRSEVENLVDKTNSNMSENVYSIGIVGDSDINSEVAKGFALLCQTMSEAGISVVLPTSASLLQSKIFLTELFEDASFAPNIDAANIPKVPGVHIMETYSDQFVENITVLGASGVQLFIAYDDCILPQGHPFIPMLRICASGSDADSRYAQVFDVNTLSSSLLWIEEVVDTIRDIQAGDFKIQPMLNEYVDFRIPRGPSAVSM